MSGDSCRDKLCGAKTRQEFRGAAAIRPGQIVRRLEPVHSANLHTLVRRRPDHGAAEVCSGQGIQRRKVQLNIPRPGTGTRT